MANIKFGNQAVGGTSYQPTRPDMSLVANNSNKCAKCGKAVYMAEELLAAGKKWHKLCFKCSKCRKMLDSSTMAEHGGELFCKSCHSRNFGTSGYGYGIGAGTLSSEKRDVTDNGAINNNQTAKRVTAVSHPSAGYTGWSGDGKQYLPARKEIVTNPNACGKCNKAVYMAEEILAAGKKWHKMCFKCENCKKLLDSSTMASHDGELYCKSCHTRKFGTTGYGYGVGAGTLASEKGVTQDKGSWLPSSTSFERRSGGGSIMQFGGAPKCPRCEKSVYAAEKIIGAGKDWHKACFNCLSCHKSLDSTTMSDNEGEIYCRGCYGKQFGPKGVGFGLGAGILST